MCGKMPKRDGITLHVDHVTPESKGGTSSITNLQTLCASCNLTKGAKLHTEKETTKKRVTLYIDSSLHQEVLSLACSRKISGHPVNNISAVHSAALREYLGRDENSSVRVDATRQIDERRGARGARISIRKRLELILRELEEAEIPVGRTQG
jgi:hypothetical protein